ncbi:MAG TPA: hypothetical protein VFE50_02505 [Cyclobacteriaceae bacterium]|nr:hypothetical protein [Cyclobacteriaceae bacterium]
MKKLIALAVVCGFAFTFIACGGGAKTEEKTEETAPAAAPADTVKKDSTDSIPK